MSGHSHWAGIKQRKGVNDAKRAGVFTKVARIVTVAAREGGSGNPDLNFQLRIAIDQARAVNMPKDNIDRAIARGTGELKDGAEITEVLYEAYLPGKIAVLIKGMTDNKNRTVSEIKSLLTKGGGKFVPEGSVAFLFQSVGEIVATPPEGLDREAAEFAIIEAGADDLEWLDDTTVGIYTSLAGLQSTVESLRAQGFTLREASPAYRPLQTTSLDATAEIPYDSLKEKLEEHPDVSAVYTNWE